MTLRLLQIPITISWGGLQGCSGNYLGTGACLCVCVFVLAISGLHVRSWHQSHMGERATNHDAASLKLACKRSICVHRALTIPSTPACPHVPRTCPARAGRQEPWSGCTGTSPCVFQCTPSSVSLTGATVTVFQGAKVLLTRTIKVGMTLCACVCAREGAVCVLRPAAATGSSAKA